MTDEVTNGFYARNYGALLDTVLEHRELYIQDGERLVDSLAGHLADFTCATDAEYIQWAVAILQPAAERLAAFYRFRTPEHEYAVHGGIRSVLSSAADLGPRNDLGEDDATVEEIANRAWTSIFEHLEGWITPGTAKLSVRLWDKGVAQAMGWKSERTRHKKKHDSLDLLIATEQRSGLTVAANN